MEAPDTDEGEIRQGSENCPTPEQLEKDVSQNSPECNNDEEYIPMEIVEDKNILQTTLLEGEKSHNSESKIAEPEKNLNQNLSISKSKEESLSKNTDEQSNGMCRRPIEESDIPVNQITINRKVIARESDLGIEELAESFRENGQKNPICATKTSEGYMVFSGYRRYEAAKYLQWAYIRANIYPSTISFQEMVQLAAIDNNSKKIASQDLAKKWWELSKIKKWTHKQIAAKYGGSSRNVGLYLNVHEIAKDESLYAFLSKKEISWSHLIPLCNRFRDKLTAEERKHWLNEIPKENLGVDPFERKIEEYLQQQEQVGDGATNATQDKKKTNKKKSNTSSITKRIKGNQKAVQSLAPEIIEALIESDKHQGLIKDFIDELTNLLGLNRLREHNQKVSQRLQKLNGKLEQQA